MENADLLSEEREEMVRTTLYGREEEENEKRETVRVTIRRQIAY
jgi:hypothetical protein